MPLNAFIIRPFGKKKVLLPPDGKEIITIDFDRVEEKLLGPALERLGVVGRTTLDIIRAGNIRENMFHRLLTADLVIADLSIHNANVFYELGLRHAFRDKYTFMVRSISSEYPFDLQTDLYLAYDKDKPAASLEALVKALRQTLNSDKEDSPVYKLIPDLKAQDRARHLAPPREFTEAVERAKNKKQSEKLRLLAAEAEGFFWEVEALREVGRAQAELDFYWSASATWEALQHRYPDDLETNIMLATIYQRLQEQVPEQTFHSYAEQALRRVRTQKELERNRRSEVLALDGRQHKADWRRAWEQIEDAEQRRQQALDSAYLEKAILAYEDAFYENLNNYHAGLNALALLKIEEKLAADYTEVWKGLYDEPDKESGEVTARTFRLQTAVALSLEAERRSIERERKGKKDFWLELNEAIFFFLTSRQGRKVAKEFEEALRNAPPALIAAVREFLGLFERLGVFSDNLKTAQRKLVEVAGIEAKPSKPDGVKKRILLFAGHRVDPLSAKRQRSHKSVASFPAGKRYEELARAAIKEAVQSEQKRVDQILFGMAGGANGGEILFHEVCEELQINTKLYLASPPEQFVGDYVSLADEDDEWVERFYKLYRDRREAGPDSYGDSYGVLDGSKELPRWLQAKPGYDLRRRSNLWLLQYALVHRVLHNAEITLIALWDGKYGDAAGGLDDLVTRAKENGIKVVHLATSKIFGPTPTTVSSAPAAKSDSGEVQQ